VALPRDVDAGVGALKNVFVYNLDDLAKIAAENRSARESEIVRCRQILDQRADSLWAQLGAARLNPAVPPAPAPGFAPGEAAACVA
jgi:glutamyl-tRNA reductase